MEMFNEKKLRAEIVKQWGPAGAHVELFDNILKELSQVQLDTAIGTLEFTKKEFMDPLQTKLTRYSEVLAWYADEKNWIIPSGEGDYAEYLDAKCEMQKDSGTRAAIKEINEILGGERE